MAAARPAGASVVTCAEATAADIYNAGKGWDVQSIVYSIITLFIIIGNVGFLLERRQRQRR